MTRAADQAYGMPVTVDEVTEQLLPLDEMIKGLSPDAMIVALDRDKTCVGCLMVDPQMRSAVIEYQTTGTVLNQPSADRPITGTDMLLAAPLTSFFLSKSSEATLGSELQTWVSDVATGNRFESPRSAGLALADGRYRVLQLTIGLAGDRKGAVTLALPDLGDAAGPTSEPLANSNWAEKFEAAVMGAPAALNAELTKLTLSIGQVEALQPGQVFPLFGATVGSVRLFSANRFEVCSAKLGQSMGKRAVRVGTNMGLALGDLPPTKALAG